MNDAQIETQILNDLPGAAIEVSGEECSFEVVVISEQFEGLTTMKRQQRILGLFKDVLQTGSLHALTVKAYTFDEWNNKSSGLVQLSL